MNKYHLLLLRLCFCGELLTAALIVLIFESGLLPAGELAHDAQAIYLAEMAGVCLTIISIPLAMKFMKFTAVRKALTARPQSYTTYSLLRLMILSVPLLVNTLFYYMTGFDATLGYLAIIMLIPYLFVWPSRARWEDECPTENSRYEKSPSESGKYVK